MSTVLQYSFTCSLLRSLCHTFYVPLGKNIIMREGQRHKEKSANDRKLKIFIKTDITKGNLKHIKVLQFVKAYKYNNNIQNVFIN